MTPPPPPPLSPRRTPHRLIARPAVHRPVVGKRIVQWQSNRPRRTVGRRKVRTINKHKGWLVTCRGKLGTGEEDEGRRTVNRGRGWGWGARMGYGDGGWGMGGRGQGQVGVRAVLFDILFRVLIRVEYFIQHIIRASY